MRRNRDFWSELSYLLCDLKPYVKTCRQIWVVHWTSISELSSTTIWLEFE